MDSPYSYIQNRTTNTDMWTIAFRVTVLLILVSNFIMITYITWHFVELDRWLHELQQIGR